jgi:hypothetical protein
MIIDIKALQAETEVSAQNTQLYLEPGIHENVVLSEIAIKDTPIGVKVLELIFRKDNKKSSFSEWLDEAKEDEALKKVVLTIINVLNAVVPKSVINAMPNTEGIIAFAEQAAMVLNAYKDQAKLRLKTVYVKDKVRVPLHSRMPWIENMNETESKIQIMPRDVMTLQQAA